MTNDIKIEAWYEDIKEREDILENVRQGENYSPKAMIEIFDAYHAKCTELANVTATKDYYKLRVASLRRTQMPNCTCEMCTGGGFTNTGENMEERKVIGTNVNRNAFSCLFTENEKPKEGENMEEKKDVKRWFDRQVYAREDSFRGLPPFMVKGLFDAYHAQKAELERVHRDSGVCMNNWIATKAELGKYRADLISHKEVISKQQREMNMLRYALDKTHVGEQPADTSEVDNLKADLKRVNELEKIYKIYSEQGTFICKLEAEMGEEKEAYKELRDEYVTQKEEWKENLNKVADELERVNELVTYWKKSSNDWRVILEEAREEFKQLLDQQPDRSEGEWECDISSEAIKMAFDLPQGDYIVHRKPSPKAEQMPVETKKSNEEYAIGFINESELSIDDVVELLNIIDKKISQASK